MSVRVDFRWPEELLAGIDAARGDVPRALFVRRAIERHLAAITIRGDDEGAEFVFEQPRRIPIPGPNVENIRSSAQAKATVRPFPKGKR